MDFAQLVAKMNEIENSKKPEEVIQESGTTKTEVGATKDLLTKFKLDVGQLLPEEARNKLPAIPASGDLNLALLHQSKFFFA